MRRAPAAEFSGTARFEVLRCLGAGGMGVVYEAIDRERNNKVALKTLKSMNADALLRFKNEFREFQDLHHPNLVSVGELYFEGGDWFFTMELVEGTNFLEYVRPGIFAARGYSFEGLPVTPVTPSAETLPGLTAPVGIRPPSALSFHEGRLRPALRQLALGVTALHEARKVHRDLKPSNVLVSEHGRVVVLDFGLATDLEGREHKSEVDIVGTVEYMAPEQAAARQVGPEADWYAVGVMLYEALTGQVPLSGPAIEVLMNKQRLDAPSPRTINPQVPSDLDELCKDLLRFNPSARPTGAKVLERLGARAERSSTASLSSFSGSSHFVGRDRELKLLREHFEESRATAEIVAVRGESGVGKSALVRRFVDQLPAREPNLVALAGTCYERESVPYKGVDGVIDALSRFMRRLPKAEAAALLPRRASLLATVFPVLARVEAVAEAPRAPDEVLEPQELRSRLFAALRELVQRLTDRHPLVIVIDDLQWADPDSLALLSELVRPPDASPFLVLVTVRSAGGAAEPGVLLPGMKNLELERMSPAEARDLATGLLKRAHAPAGLKAHQIAQEAGGHPLFIDEIIRHAVAIGGKAEAPLQLEDALWARIHQLAPEARRVLELACLAGGRLLQQTAAQAAGMGLGDLGKQVALLRVAHLARTTGMRGTDLVEPYHGRVRAAVLDHLAPDEARALHRRLAVALETSDKPDPEALATHWHEAGERDKAIRFAALAGDKAARALAFDRAVRFYQLALELSPERPRELEVKLADALASNGRGGEAGAAYLAAALGAGPSEALELRRRAAEQLLRSGHIDEGLQAIRAVLDAVGMKMPTTPKGALTSLLFRRALLRARGLGYKERDESQLTAKELSLIDICWSVAAGLGVVDTIRGAEFQTRQTLLALKAGEPNRVVRALAAETVSAAVGGERTRPRTDRLLATAMALAQRIGHPNGLGLTTWADGVAAFLQGRWKEGAARSLEAESLLRDRCTGVTWELDTARFFSLWSAFYLGDLVGLLGRLPLLVRESEARGDLYAVTNLRTSFTPLGLLAAGDPKAARAEAEAAIHRWSRQGFHVQHYNALLAEVQADLYEGLGGDATRRIETAWTMIERAMLLEVQQMRVRALHLRAASRLAVGDRRGALRLAHRFARECAWGRAFALAIRAGCSRAAAEFAAAAEAFDGCGMALYAACARRRVGELAGGAQGAETVAAADAWLAGRRVRDPARFTQLLVPLAPSH